MTFAEARDVAPPASPVDLVLHLELLRDAALDIDAVHVLVPNPEWFAEKYRRRLARVHAVFAKTREAERIFRSLGCATSYVGFSSEDRRLAGLTADPAQWLHPAGQSPHRGTEAVVLAWARHPEWPHLTLVQWGEGDRPRAPLPNVSVVSRRLADAELQALQASCGVHVIPSETEGWGHSIAEALSVPALVVTTAAPPMDEQVSEERGVLCPVESTCPKDLATRHRVGVRNLEATVARVLALSLDDAGARRARARAWFEENDRAFRSRLPQTVEALLARARPRRRWRRGWLRT